jgi:hypothetical protein
MDGMYWGDVRALIERNKRPWSILKYFRSKEGFSDTISVCDMTLPKRAGFVKTGYTDHDWWRDSFVCNASYFNGFIPMRDATAEWDDLNRKWIDKPTRGIRHLLRILISNRVIDKSEEVARIVDSR